MARVSVRIGFSVTVVLLAGCGASGQHPAALSAPTVLASADGSAPPSLTLERSASAQPSSSRTTDISSAIATTASPSPSSSGLAPPSSTLPPARPCRPYPAPIVTITVNPDTPTPDCVIVSKTQRLRVENATNAFNQPGQVITIRFGGLPPRTLRIGESTTYEMAFGSYLALGQHYMQSSSYPGSNFVIWLQ
jgi:hypothetical protein